MVFDREGSGKSFFLELINSKCSFVTWEKNIDKQKLDAIEPTCFLHDFTFNNKEYSVFEGNKNYAHKQDNEIHSFDLRRIYIWNKKTNKRVCGLAWDKDSRLTTEDCAKAILSRWGASENTFKHIATKHPLHYHPGFKLIKSGDQEIANPELKKKQKQTKTIKKDLDQLYKKLARKEPRINDDGRPRANKTRLILKEAIETKELELKSMQKEICNLPERVDISTMEDYRSFNKLDNEGKRLFDFVTTSVWNARKYLVDNLTDLSNYNINQNLILYPQGN